MTRDKKISKLANAIREYRGRYDETNGDWMHPPKPHRVEGVKRWATELGMDPDVTVSFVNAIPHIDDFNKWIKSL